MGAEALREVPLWVGRDGLLAELKAALIPPAPFSQPWEKGESCAAPKVLVLVGQGGIGKTSLALKLLEASGVDLKRGLLTEACGYGGVVCFRAEEGAGFDEVAGVLLGAFGLGQQEFVQDGEKVRAILAGLRQQRWLVLLDNWEVMLHPGNASKAGRCMAEGLGQLLNGLVYQQHQSQVIITSRERLKDLADSRDGEGGVDPRLVREVVVEGIDEAASVALLKQLKLRDCEADLQWIAERVQGNVLVLTLLANLAIGKKGYLRKNPQLVSCKAEPILEKQLERQSEAAVELLKRMCVLRRSIGVEGLTFLRLHVNKTGIRGDEFAELVAFLEEEIEIGTQDIEQTELLLKQLSNAFLVQSVYNEEHCEDLYNLHQVIREFLQSKHITDLPEIMQQVHRFYRDIGYFRFLRSGSDLNSALEAQAFAMKLGDYDEAWRLLELQILDEWYQREAWTPMERSLRKILPHLQGCSQVQCLRLLSVVKRKSGDWNEADQLFQDASRLSEKMGGCSAMVSSWIAMYCQRD